MSVIYGGSSITFDDGSTVGSGWTGHKNRIINGNFQIDQRNRGAANTTSNFVLDRWLTVYTSSAGTITTQRSTDAPAGYANSMLMTVASNDSSLASSDRYMIQQAIEGYNVADFNLGTTNAATFTLSFWVKSSVTGTYSIAITNGLNAVTLRSYSADYTISQANTWEKKTITVVGDTSSVGLSDWSRTNATGLNVRFGLALGSSHYQSTGTWQSNNVSGSPNQVNWMATNGNTFQLAGVQLEKGPNATSFEFRPYTTELQLCYRYYWTPITENLVTASWPCVTVTGAANGLFQAWFNFPVTMRTTPSLTTANLTGHGNAILNWVGPGSSTLATITGIVYQGENQACMQGTQTASFAGAGYFVTIQFNNAIWASNGGRLAFDAEL